MTVYIIRFTFALGVINRRCIEDNEWEEVFGCFKEDTGKLLNQVIIVLMCGPDN